MRNLRRLAAATTATLGLSLSGLAVGGAVMPAHADDTTTAATTDATSSGSATTDRLAALTLDDPTAQAALDRIVALLPAHADPTKGGQALDAMADDGELSGVAKAAIDPSQYSCSSTPLFAWIVDQLGTDPDVLNALDQVGIISSALYYALKFEDGSQPQYMGTNGQYTDEMESEFHKLKDFWDIDSSKIQLVGMHSTYLRDTSKLVPFLQWYWGVDAAMAEQLAPQVEQLVAELPQGADNPYFTFNSFAYGGGDNDPSSPFNGIAPKIMIGDGIAEGLAAVGLDDDTAMEAVMGHEYGHEVQFADGFDQTTLTGPEASRRLELMADAFGSYFMVHVHGEHAKKQRVLDTEQTFYEVGDCSFTSGSHHGTPDQRLASSTWAADLAEDIRPQGQALPATNFYDRFEQEYPTIIAPNA